MKNNIYATHTEMPTNTATAEHTSWKEHVQKKKKTKIARVLLELRGALDR